MVILKITGKRFCIGKGVPPPPISLKNIKYIASFLLKNSINLVNFVVNFFDTNSLKKAFAKRYNKVAPIVFPKTIAGADEPGISTNEIKTKLLVTDGDIVVIGGIKKNTKNNTNTKTTGISDVPVVGNLFKGKNKTDELKELLIFIAPRVIQ